MNLINNVRHYVDKKCDAHTCSCAKRMQRYKKKLVLIQFLCKNSLVSLKNTIYFSKFAPFQHKM